MACVHAVYRYRSAFQLYNISNRSIQFGNRRIIRYQVVHFDQPGYSRLERSYRNVIRGQICSVRLCIQCKLHAAEYIAIRVRDLHIIHDFAFGGRNKRGGFSSNGIALFREFLFRCQVGDRAFYGVQLALYRGEQGTLIGHFLLRREVGNCAGDAVELRLYIDVFAGRSGDTADQQLDGRLIFVDLGLRPGLELLILRLVSCGASPTRVLSALEY